MDGQDWTPVVLHRKKEVAHKKQTQYSEEAARLARVEAGVSVVKKFLSPESVALVLAYRRNNSLTQRELDARLSWPANTVNALEGRRLTPTSHQINQLSRLINAVIRLA